MMRILVSIVQLLFVLIIYSYLVDTFESIMPGAYFLIYFHLFLGSFAIQGISYIIAILSGSDSRIFSFVIPAVNFISFTCGNIGAPIERLHYVWQFVSLFSIHRFINEATLLFQYGFDRCGHREVQKTLHAFRIDTNEEYFYFCQRMLIFHVLFYNTIALLILLVKMNPFNNRHNRNKRILDRHQLMIKSKQNPNRNE